MKRYRSYKPSGIPWIGEIPEHWVIKKLKWSLQLSRGFDLPSHEFVRGNYPVYGSNGIIGYHEEYKAKGPGITIGRSGSVGAVNYVESDFWPHNTCLYVERNFDNDWRYVFYYLQCMNLKSLSSGTAVGTLNRNYIHDEFVGFPSEDEQFSIAEYLNYRTTQIDELIAKKQQLIDLLNEEKTAIINHAVTKGLNPSAPMKHTGIPWLGKVPGHWEVKRLKFVSTLQTGLTLGKKYSDQKLVSRPYLRVANVQDGYLDLDVITEIALPPADVRRYELEPGDVVMTEGGDFDKLGRGYVWENQIPGCLHQNHIFAVRPKQTELNPHFLSVMLTSSHGKNYFTSTSQQTTNLATTNRTKVLSFPVPLPPLDEQEAIVGRLSNSLGQLEALVAKVGSIIEQLREYRTTLISAAVTGKIDVREYDSLAAKPYRRKEW